MIFGYYFVMLLEYRIVMFVGYCFIVFFRSYSAIGLETGIITCYKNKRQAYE